MAVKEEVVNVDRTLAMTLVERLYVQKALQVFYKSLERSRNNEMAASEVYQMRTKELAVVRDLMNRVA